jgi:hypothetical protein
MSMYMLNCPTCLVEKPQSCKHVRQVETEDNTDRKFFTCHQCHKKYEIVEESAEHLVVGAELS